MTLKAVLCVVAVAVVSGASVFAQGRDRTAGDPITGTWGADGATFLELRHDGRGRVTGTAIWRQSGQETGRSPVSVGTYDANTRAVKLEGTTRGRDGGTVGYVIEGTVQNNSMSGRYRVGSDEGSFTFTRR